MPNRHDRNQENQSHSRREDSYRRDDRGSGNRRYSYGSPPSHRQPSGSDYRPSRRDGFKHLRSHSLGDVSFRNVSQATRDITLFEDQEDVILSTFYRSKLKVWGHRFWCAEQAIQFKRAEILGEDKVCQSILSTKKLKDIRQLSLSLKDRDRDWDKAKAKIVSEVVHAKAKYVSEFRTALLTSKTVITKAEDTSSRDSSSDWPGCNNIGRILMQMRDKLFKRGDFVTPFQGANDVLSNFYPCRIRLWNRVFKSSEHAYQYSKAETLGNQNIANSILSSPAARDAKMLSKSLGRGNPKWDGIKLDTMREIIRAKAQSVPEFKQAILNSNDVIAEAVDRDKIWSAGLSKEDVVYKPPSQWPGRNIMGKLHMELKAEMQGTKCPDFDFSFDNRPSVRQRLGHSMGRQGNDEYRRFEDTPKGEHRNRQPREIYSRGNRGFAAGVSEENYSIKTPEEWKTSRSRRDSGVRKEPEDSKKVLDFGERRRKIDISTERKDSLHSELVEESTKMRKNKRRKSESSDSEDSYKKSKKRKQSPVEKASKSRKRMKIDRNFSERLPVTSGKHQHNAKQKEIVSESKSESESASQSDMDTESKRTESPGSSDNDKRSKRSESPGQSDMDKRSKRSESPDDSDMDKKAKRSESPEERDDHKRPKASPSPSHKGKRSKQNESPNQTDKPETAMEKESPGSGKNEENVVFMDTPQQSKVSDRAYDGAAIERHKRSWSAGDIGFQQKRPSRSSNVTVFEDAESQILSNYYPCNIELWGHKFSSAEHAIQYKKFEIMQENQIIDFLLSTTSLTEILQIKEALKDGDEEWKNCEERVMREVICVKAKCLPEFRTALLLSQETIAKAGENEKFWSTGLNSEASKQCMPSEWPGSNKMGNLLMEVRAELLKQQCYLTAFQGQQDVLSNFYLCEIWLWGKAFKSSEHAYQFKKAETLGNQNIANSILSSPAARDAKMLSKSLGRGNPKWDGIKLDTMRQIIRAKAQSVPEFKQAILNSNDVIAEAVDRDKVWSAGLSKEDIASIPPSKWPGRNIMGKLHMELKAELQGTKCPDFDFSFDSFKFPRGRRGYSEGRNRGRQDSMNSSTLSQDTPVSHRYKQSRKSRFSASAELFPGGELTGQEIVGFSEEKPERPENIDTVNQPETKKELKEMKKRKRSSRDSDTDEDMEVDVSVNQKDTDGTLMDQTDLDNNGTKDISPPSKRKKDKRGNRKASCSFDMTKKESKLDTEEHSNKCSGDDFIETVALNHGEQKTSKGKKKKKSKKAHKRNSSETLQGIPLPPFPPKEKTDDKNFHDASKDVPEPDRDHAQDQEDGEEKRLDSSENESEQKQMDANEQAKSVKDEIVLSEVKSDKEKLKKVKKSHNREVKESEITVKASQTTGVKGEGSDSTPEKTDRVTNETYERKRKHKSKTPEPTGKKGHKKIRIKRNF